MKLDGFELSDGQKYIPISAELGRHSLSAILLDDAYFGLIQAHHDEQRWLWIGQGGATGVAAGRTGSGAGSGAGVPVYGGGV